MGFADWFDLLPKVATFRPFLFCGPILTLEEGIKAAAWRLSVSFPNNLIFPFKIWMKSTPCVFMQEFGERFEMEFRGKFFAN